MTSIDFGPPYQKSIEYSVDELLKIARESFSLLANNSFWPFIFPWLHNSDAEIQRFWKSYDSENACAERKKSVVGAKAANYAEARGILGLVDEFKALTGIIGKPKKEKPAPLLSELTLSDDDKKLLIENIVQELGQWTLKSVMSDPAAFKRLHLMLTTPAADVTDAYDDPENFSSKGGIYRAFIGELTEFSKLPTKKTVRKRAGLADDDSALTTAAMAFRSLGLGGLPQG